MSTRFVIVFLLVVSVSGLGCTGSYYNRYMADYPGWFSTFPDEGAGLYETLAGLQAPQRYDYQLSVTQLAVLKVAADGVTELSPEQIDRALLLPPGDDHFAIVATVSCRSEIDTNMYWGQKVEWMLFEGGRLSAWDIHLFASRCVVGNDFRPARGVAIPLEEQIVSFRQASFPRSMGHAIEYYGKGLAYLKEGRVTAAEQMLAKGDETFDPTNSSGARFARPSDKVTTSTTNDIARRRASLARGIDAMRAVEGSGM
jgi:hypothetical protein